MVSQAICQSYPVNSVRVLGALSGFSKGGHPLHSGHAGRSNTRVITINAQSFHPSVTDRELCSATSEGELPAAGLSFRSASAPETAALRSAGAHLPTILIADDYAAIRSAIRAGFENCSGLLVCGEAADGVDAIEKAIRLKPDLILLDLSMPRMNGLDLGFGSEGLAASGANRCTLKSWASLSQPPLALMRCLLSLRE